MSNSRAIGATPFDVGSNLLLGWFFLAIGMLCNAILWNSLGEGWVAWLMALVGIGFDLAKIRLLNNSAYCFKYSSYLGGTFYFFWFFIMTLLSMFAASGFFLLQITTTQQQAAINGEDYKLQQQRYEIAQQQYDANAAYATLNPSTLIAERDQKINAILSMSLVNSNGDPAGTLASTTNGCTNQNTWYYREYGHYCTEIESIRVEYQKEIDSAETAQNALAVMGVASDGKKSAANNVSAGTPIFDYSAKFFGITAQNFLLIFVVIVAIVTELLASILLGSAYLLNKAVRPSIDLIRQVKIAELEMKRELLALQQIPNADKLAANAAGYPTGK
jgi:hypothetical protein